MVWEHGITRVISSLNEHDSYKQFFATKEIMHLATATKYKPKSNLISVLSTKFLRAVTSVKTGTNINLDHNPVGRLYIKLKAQKNL